MMTITGFPPAGGCTTFSNIIKKIPVPTAIAILMNIGNGIRFTKIIPTKAVTKCPKKTFRGGVQMDSLESQIIKPLMIQKIQLKISLKHFCK